MALPSLISERVLISMRLTCSLALTVSIGWVRNFAMMLATEDAIEMAIAFYLSSFFFKSEAALLDLLIYNN